MSPAQSDGYRSGRILLYSFIAWILLNSDRLQQLIRHTEYSELLIVVILWMLLTPIAAGKGFRKVNPYQWEFADEAFIVGQKLLPKDIGRWCSSKNQMDHYRETEHVFVMDNSKHRRVWWRIRLNSLTCYTLIRSEMLVDDTGCEPLIWGEQIFPQACWYINDISSLIYKWLHTTMHNGAFLWKILQLLYIWHQINKKFQQYKSFSYFAGWRQCFTGFFCSTCE